MKLHCTVESELGELVSSIDVSGYTVRRLKMVAGSTIDLAASEHLLVMSNFPVDITNNGKTFTTNLTLFQPVGVTRVESLNDCFIKIVEMV